MSAFNMNNSNNNNILKFSGKQIPISNEDSNSNSNNNVNNYLNIRENSSSELLQSNHNTIDSYCSRSNNNININNIKTYNPNVTNLAALTQMNQSIITRDRSITPGTNKKRYLIPKSVE